LAQWIWVDVFTKIPVTETECARLKEAGYRLCFVSPELQGRPENVEEYRRCIGHCMDMVCTKIPTAWQGVSSPSDTSTPSQPEVP